ncbi:hypothetical protein CGCF415_v008655 [Colletotrichum fructicola]|nr:uncharacterized protein CGCA056_v010555 [Colletotrichum aenigma]KAF4823888.1 hypothetical protein CGCSCA5_v001554 [Colletotrichum siamense]KAF4883977.1 hypothetical protein CGCFRS4_v013078 [Colletotrichum fructicola]KAF4850516.1 hypothetical protein CGCSCA4_v003982 [Colletotrichum siamense]KAF4862488.1 hypothetical protein CGCSCA2_v003728 [Colletotrichum siamense]KAF4868443.1 hypothetical protein CGCSCA1_v012335 [Colletotrichum siamense]
MAERNDNRRSFDSQASSSTLGAMPVVEVESYLTAPAARWSTANRI